MRRIPREGANVFKDRIDQTGRIGRVEIGQKIHQPPLAVEMPRMVTGLGDAVGIYHQSTTGLQPDNARLISVILKHACDQTLESSTASGGSPGVDTSIGECPALT